MEDEMLLKLEALRMYLLTLDDILGVSRKEVMTVMKLTTVDYRDNYTLIYKVCELTSQDRDEAQK